MLETGDQFYISEPKQFRGFHFTVVNEYPDVFEVVDSSRDSWDLVRGEDDFLMNERSAKLSISVPKENIVVEGEE